MSGEAAQGGTSPTLPGPHKIYAILKDDPIYRLLLLTDAAVAIGNSLQSAGHSEAHAQVSAVIKTFSDKMNALAKG
jgi:hypothetical protein